MNEVEFLNAIVQEANCGIHLDVNNIYVNAVNHGLLDPHVFIDNVDLNVSITFILPDMMMNMPLLKCKYKHQSLSIRLRVIFVIFPIIG